MSNSNFLLDDLEKAVENLKEVLELEKNEINRDSAIKRFELCFDLVWKSIKLAAKNKGLECFSPKDCFKAAFQMKIIEHDESIIEIIKYRNLTAHTYKEELADEVYSKLPFYLIIFENLLQKLKQQK